MLCQSKVPAIERQLQDAGVQNTSGRLTWRIDNVSQRMEEARTGTIPALYSQPFFTDDAGNIKTMLPLGWPVTGTPYTPLMGSASD